MDSVIVRQNENIHENKRVGSLLGLWWVDMQNYRDPPPYPGHSKQVYPNQPGFRQSFSGSETSTDVSLSSTENLATSQRQEPQGEETQTSFCAGNSYSILERLALSANVIDSSGKLSGSGGIFASPTSGFSQENILQQHSTALNSTSNSLGLSAGISPLYSHTQLSIPQQLLGSSILQHQGDYSRLQQNEATSVREEYSSSRSEAESVYSSSSSASSVNACGREGTGHYPGYSSSLGRTGSPGRVLGSNSGLVTPSNHQYLSPRVPPVSTYHHPHPYVNTHWTEEGENGGSQYSGYRSASSLTYSQSGGGGGTVSLSSQDQILSYMTNLPPPPQYPGGVRGLTSHLSKSMDVRAGRSYEVVDRADTSGTNVDLRACAGSPGIHTQNSSRQANICIDDNEQTSDADRLNQKVEILINENRALKEELTLASNKVARLQKLEMEMQKVHESHEALVKSSQKQESLWLAMRRKLETTIQNLKAQLDNAESGKVSGTTSDSQSRISLAEKDAMISKLLSQNQDLVSSREQLETDNTQLNVCVAEKRARMDILENALLNAQTKVVALEEEYRRQQCNAEKVEQLKNSLVAMQSASERQEKKERELRSHLEKELEMYRAQEKGGALKKAELAKEDIKSSGMLRKMLDEKDARILQLETDLAVMEQKYIQEATLRQLEMEQTSQTSKEVRLAALEKSSSNMEKLIDEAKTEKLKHMEELHQSHKKVAELEARVKQLQTQLVEKEAMLKVFQRSPLAMARSSSLHALCHPSLHSPHATLVSPHARPGSSQALESSNIGTYREFATIRHMKTGSTSAMELECKKSLEEDLLSKVQSLSVENKNDSDDEGRLFHV